MANTRPSKYASGLVAAGGFVELSPTSNIVFRILYCSLAYTAAAPDSAVIVVNGVSILTLVDVVDVPEDQFVGQNMDVTIELGDTVQVFAASGGDTTFMISGEHWAPGYEGTVA